MTQVDITPVPQDRAADLARLAREVFTESYVHDDDPEGFAAYVRTVFSDDVITQELRDPSVALRWALDEQGEPIGFMKADSLQPPQHHESLPAVSSFGGLHVQRLYVRRVAQRSGLGRGFVGEAKRIATSRGHSHLWLCVWDQNEDAITFYDRLGFTEIGAHPYVIGSETHRDLSLMQPL